MNIIEHIFDHPFLMRIFDKLLTDQEKLNLICNKFIYERRTKLRFHNPVSITRRCWIKWYYNCLTHVIMTEMFKLPKHVTHLKLYIDEDEVEFDEIQYGEIPSTITHLHLGGSGFSEFSIPNSITHFYTSDSQVISYIDSSSRITHLEIEDYEDEILENLKNNDSIEFLITDGIYGESLEDLLLKSVKHLTIKSKLEKEDDKKIPSFVTNLSIRNHKKFKFPSTIKVTEFNSKNKLSVAGFPY